VSYLPKKKTSRNKALREKKASDRKQEEKKKDLSDIDTNLTKVLDELKIDAEIVDRNGKKIVVVKSIPDAFKLYRHGIYDVEIDRSKSLIKRKD